MANSKQAQPLGGRLGDFFTVPWRNHARHREILWLDAWNKAAGVMLRTPGRGSLSLWGPWAFCFGAAAYFFPLYEPSPFLPLAVLLVCLGVGYWVHRRTGSNGLWAIFILVMIATFLSGWGRAQWRSHSRAAPVLSAKSTVYKGHGLVLGVDKERGHRARYLIAPSSLGRLSASDMPKRIRMTAFANDAQTGDQVNFTAALQAPPKARFPGAYNFAKAAWFKSIGGTGFSYGHLRSLGVSPQTPGFSLRLAKIRRKMAVRIRESLGGQKGAIAAALVTGDRSAINNKTAEDLRVAGLAHMLAISGLHMGLVAGLVFGVGGMMFAAISAIGEHYDARKPAALLGLLVATGYLLLSGAGAPTERAFVMTAVALGAVLFNRRALSLRTISIAALMVAVLNPENVISPGFIMSFSAALALIAFYEWAGSRVQLLPRPVGFSFLQTLSRLAAIIGALALTSLVAGFATGPFAAFYFHRAAVYGLIANIAAMPVFTFIVMPALLAGTLLDVIGMGAPFYALAGWGLDLIINIAHGVALMPGALARIPAAPPLVPAIMAAGLLLLCLTRSFRRLWGVASIVVGVMIWSNTSPPDGLITANGGAIKVMVNDEIRLVGFGTFSKFELGQLASALAIAPQNAIHIKKASKVLSCDAAGCMAQLMDGRRIVFNLDMGQLEEDCRHADIVVAGSAPSARTATRCPAGRLIRPAMNEEVTYFLNFDHEKAEKIIPNPIRPWSKSMP